MVDERQDEVNAALKKGGLALLVLCVVILLGTMLMVKALGLNDPGDSGVLGNSAAPVTPLPTTALPVPGQTQSDDTSPADPGTESDTPAAHGLNLSVSPVFARPGDRINLTGNYAGHDAQQLQVQRKQDGHWVNFPVHASVNAGTFATFVMTSRVGDNRFRVTDPASGASSNVVLVTVQ